MEEERRKTEEAARATEEVGSGLRGRQGEEGRRRVVENDWACSARAAQDVRRETMSERMEEAESAKPRWDARSNADGKTR